MGTDPSEIYELSKITKMAVFYSGNQIVFVIRIPLITELELTLFRILPIPHPIETNSNGIIDRKHSVILKPEFQYVGITKNRRQYTTFTETQLLHCTETEIFTICPEFQPVQHESKKQPCEISLFKNPDVLPQTCEAGIVILTKNIFHKLKYMNAWIYTTTDETLTITCQGNREPYIVKIRQQGLIKLNHDCRAYGEDIILNPTRDIKSKYYVNFIPKIGTGKIIVTIPNKIKDIKLPKTNVKYDPHKLDNVHEMAHSLDDVQGMIDNEILRQSGHEVDNNQHHYLLYMTLGLLIVTIMLLLFIYVTYKCQLSTWAPVRQPRYHKNVEPGSRSRFYVETPITENIVKTNKGPLLGDTPDNLREEVTTPMIKC